jgi:RNA polymerase sigma-70 factor (ECF subfamily)
MSETWTETTGEEVERLFGEMRGPLLRYVRGMGLAEAEGEDVTQDAFIALFRHLREGKPRDNLRAWLFRVARNFALKRLERGQGEAELADSVDGTANPEEQAARRQRERMVRGVIEVLPAVDRRCLELRAEGLRYREIAESLGISLGSVAASLGRSLGRIARVTEGVRE